MEGYQSFSDWQRDYIKYLKNDRDDHLKQAISKKFSKTSKNIKEKINIYLQNSMLEIKPLYVLQKVSEELGPKFKAMIKHIDDIWFDC